MFYPSCVISRHKLLKLIPKIPWGVRFKIFRSFNHMIRDSSVFSKEVIISMKMKDIFRQSDEVIILPTS